MKKLALIGPIHPFPGGISHYNQILFSKFLKEKKVDIKLYTFSRFYPKKFYPGKTILDKGEPAVKLPKEKVIESIDWLNPISWYKTAKSINKFNADILIFHWWTWFWFFPFYSVTLFLNKKTKIIIIAHNVFDHEGSKWKNKLSLLFLSKSNRIIVHSENEKKKLLQKINQSKQPQIVVIPHPSYEDLIDKNKCSQKKGLNYKLLFFGFIRNYKGLDILLKAFAEAKKATPKLRLSIVGEFWDSKKKYLKLIKELDIENSVDIYDQYVRNEDIYKFFCPVDVVVLPYKSATGSGVLKLAVAFNKPVIATDVGSLGTEVRKNEWGFVVDPNNVTTLARAISNFYFFKKSQSKRVFKLNSLKNSINDGWGEIIRGIININNKH